MRAKCVEELQVFQKALAAADAVSAIIKRPTFDRDPRLRQQLGASSSSVPARIAEGFEQKSDRHFAHYLYIARGSAQETRTHLRVASGRGHLPSREAESTRSMYQEIASMTTGLIRHLENEDRKHRWVPSR